MTLDKYFWQIAQRRNRKINKFFCGVYIMYIHKYVVQFDKITQYAHMMYLTLTIHERVYKFKLEFLL